MTKIKKITLLISLIFAFIISLSMGSVFAVAQASLVVDETFFEKSYARNAEIVLPSATLDGAETEIYSIAPSGSTVKGNRLILTEDGEYIVVYEANDKSAKRTLRVKSAPSSLFTVSDGITLTDQKQAPAYMLEAMSTMTNRQNTVGLGVRVTENDATMHYNGIINLYDIAGYRTNFVQLLVTPQFAGVREFIDGIKFKLTDIYDENKFITMEIKANSNTTTSVFIYDSNGKEYVRFQPLLRAQSSFDGVVNSEGCINTLSVNLDIATKVEGVPTNQMAVYLDPYKVDGTSIPSRMYSLNSETEQGARALQWTTGEVYLDISFGEIEKSGAEFILTRFANLDMSVDTLQSEDFHYAYDFKDGITAETMPYGVVGVPYAIPSARGYNLVGGVVNASSFITDEDGNMYLGSMFTPQKAGKYIVQYACSLAGIEHTFFLPIVILEEYADEDELRYTVEDDTVPFGQAYAVKTGAVSGGVGNVSVTQELYVNGEKTDLLVSGDARYFIAESAKNEYVVKHYVTDYLQTRVFEQKITVEDDKPFYFNETFVPSDVMVGRNYTLIAPKAYYSDNGQLKYVESKLVVDGEEKTSLSLNTVGEHIVKFATSVNGTTYYSEEYVVEAHSDEAYVYDTEKNQKAYLYNFFDVTGGRMDVDPAINNLGVRSTATDGGLANAAFLVPVSILDASISVITVGKEQSNYDSLNIVINDLSGKKLTLKFSEMEVNGMAFTVIHIGGKEVARYQKSLVETTTNVIIKRDGSIYDGMNYNFTAKVWDDGFAFDGFSDFVWFEVQMENVTGNSLIRFGKISNQTITRAASDRVGPFLSVNQPLAANIYIKKGEIFVFPNAYAFDLLQQSGGVYITVRELGTLTELVVEQPLTEDYVFTGAERGEYLVIYTAYERGGDNKGGNSNSVQYYIKVETDVMPSISLNGSINETAAVGDKISVPMAVVDSPISTTSTIYVIDPDYANIKLEGNSLLIEKAGTYIIRYIALDEDGNYAVSEYHIKAIASETDKKAGCAGVVSLPVTVTLLGVALCVFVLARRNGKNEKI